MDGHDGTSAPTSVHEIATLVRSRHPVLVIDTVEEDRAAALIDAAAGRSACRCSSGRSPTGFAAAERTR